MPKKDLKLQSNNDDDEDYMSSGGDTPVFTNVVKDFSPNKMDKKNSGNSCNEKALNQDPDIKSLVN